MWIRAIAAVFAVLWSATGAAPQVDMHRSTPGPRIITVPSAPAPALPRLVPESESREACIKRWEQAERDKIVRGAVQRSIPAIMVDEAAWSLSDHTVQRGILETFICIFALPSGTLADVDILSHLTNKVIARWHFGAQADVAK